MYIPKYKLIFFLNCIVLIKMTLYKKTKIKKLIAGFLHIFLCGDIFVLVSFNCTIFMWTIYTYNYFLFNIYLIDRVEFLVTN